MGNPERGLAELAGALRSWVWPWPNRQEPRDFWMPDDCVRVCYDCDGQFTLFNRRHHCRVCGRVFCNRCTANTVPASALGSNSRFGNADDAAAAETASRRSPAPDEGERIRACNYCYKLWKQELEAAVLAAAMADAERLRCSTPGLSPSHSTTSLGSTKSSCTVRSNSTRGTARLYNGRVYQHAGYGAGGYGGILPEKDKRDVQRKDAGSIEENEEEEEDAGESSPNPYGYCSSRSEDEDDDYGGCHSDTEDRCFHQSNTYYNHVEFDEVNCDQPKKKTDGKDFPSHDEECMGEKALDVKGRTEPELDNIHDCDASSIYNTEEADVEPVDFENNGVLWFPPLPENEEDDQDASISDEEEDDDTASEFRYLRTSGSFDSGESRNRARTVEEHKKAMQNVLDGHFKALVSQLLQVENLQEGKDGDVESWLEIITSLSWEVASLLKPDTSSGGGMDPGGYAKIKCIASGHRSESSVLKGVVCRRNLAHRRMKSRIEKPRLLILGGALEYQRVSNLLSSFDTLLQQEMDHLKMAVTKIDAYHPDVLLVEKTVSRFAQDYLLAKDISLVLNIKRPLLERIARCTGSQIIPSIDHLSPQKLGYCDLFHVQKFVEEYGIASNSGTKQTKNLMFFEGCPKPLGCTVLLRGADRDELKRVKHVVQYAVFAAYHLALETSFLADEGASLPELPLRSPITVALPEKVSASAIGRSISMVSGFAFPNVNLVPNISRLDVSEDNNVSKFSSGLGGSSHIAKFSARPEGSCKDTTFSPGNLDENFGRHSVWEKHREDILRYSKEKNNEIDSEYSSLRSSSRTNNSDTCNIYPFWGRKTSEAPIGERLLNVKQMQSLDFGKLLQDNDNSNTNQDEDQIPIDEFPPSPSNHQSILVSLSTRCVWKGTVCERAHLFRIKYYGSFDKPLGRFLRDHLFDQGYRCRMCEMPSEAHVHCYTHRQGSLTISVKKFPEEVLRGQRIGKIWMWHRCLRCPRRGGMPPETRRVIMSDAAWGLSFGKFLELSFSNHAAASRVASCGHSLHRDCLRFYGFGTMVACFRYASIDVNSVYLPPAQLDFNIQHEDWLQNELNKVVEKADLLFTEVLNGINHVAERINSVLPSSHLKSPDSKLGIVELRGIWQKEKAEFEETLSKLSDNSLIKGQPDLIEINKLHRKLFFHAYLWDRRLIFAAGFDNYNEGLGSMTLNKEKLTSLLEPGVINSLSRPQNTSSNLDSSSTENMDDAVNIEGTRPTGNEGEIPSPSNLVPSVDQEGGLPHGTDTGESHSHNLLMVNDDQDDSLHLDSAIQKALSVADISLVQALPDTLDAKWTGEDGSVPDLSQSDTVDPFENQNIATEPQNSDDVCYKTDVVQSNGFPTGEGKRDLSILVEMPFSKFYSAINKNHAGETPLFQILHEYNPVYISSFRELDRQGDAKVLLPLGIDGIFVPIFDDEPASIICHALVSFEYHSQMAEEQDRSKDGFDISTSLPASDSGSFNPLASLDEVITESLKSVYSVDDTMLSLLSSSSIQLDPVLCSKNLHIKVSFTDECSSGKMRYTVTCYYAKQFHSLRRICCPHELDFIKSLSRCKKWGAQGGKSNVFFAKSLDDRFVIKQVTKTELESFIKFAPRYFKYLSDSIGTKSPTCLAKILGIYQVSCKHLKGGKESKMDVLVMENLLFGRNISRLYDLKGSSRSRYNADSNGNNKVLLDQNLIESMPTSPIFVGNKAKRLLERAVWNDTSFLANIDVMDYSLLVGIDEEKHELVLGIIDFMRQYTWDKHLETWVKASGILGGPKNSDPTVISPKQYKKRFRKAMAAYFLMVPDQWSPPSVAPSRSHSDFGEEV